MIYKKLGKLFFALGILSGIPTHVFADANDNPCVGSLALLSIVDRPTVGDSACVVPFKKAILELGFQYQKVSHAGYQQNFPEAEFRLGLPANTEFVVLSNYIHQNFSPRAGYAASVVGVKHQLGTSKEIQSAVEGLFTLPSGGKVFGSNSLGGAFNGIVSYNISSQFNLTCMFGVSSQTTSSNAGGQRFTSVNPDLVFTWSPKDTLDVYGEVYGQSKTGPGKGSGFNFDGGMIYLIRQNMTVDLEYGQRMSGVLDGFDRYVGTGLTAVTGSYDFTSNSSIIATISSNSNAPSYLAPFI